jgi:hypothetical protein
MFGYRDDIPGTGLLEQPGPLAGVKLFGPELGDKVFIAELAMGAVGFDMVVELFGPLEVHISGIPFIRKSRHTVNAPMDEDAKLSIQIPLRDGVLLERFPGLFVLG